MTAKKQHSTKGVLKVHLAPRDDPENLANLDDFRTGAAYEYARKIMISCTWTNESTGASETMNFRIEDKQLTSYERAGLALSIYDYAEGTMTIGQDAPATRDDLYKYQKDRKIALAPIAGHPCPGQCGEISTTYAIMRAHMVAKKVCHIAMTAQNFSLLDYKFVKCRGCGALLRDAQNSMHGKYGHSKQSSTCRQAYAGEQASTANGGIFTWVSHALCLFLCLIL